MQESEEQQKLKTKLEESVSSDFPKIIPGPLLNTEQKIESAIGNDSDEFNVDSVKFKPADIESSENNQNAKDTELIGKLIDSKYQIISLIGSGGMSSVYQIRHLLLNKTLALKMIHPHLASDKESLARFQREAEATSRLDHPNVVKVYEFGITAGSPYIVMDYIEGITLSQAIAKDKKLDPDRAVRIISQACAALGHAHNRNIVHRDIKPSNIMLVRNEGEADFVKVVDFGIAQVLAEDTELAKLTQTGQIFGTPMYMSPEQCQGQKLDARTDVYSLGCVFYETLSGKTPFAGSSVYELIFKQMNEAPAGLGNSVADKSKKDALETIIFRSIAKDAADRYQSMQELKDDLDHVNEAQSRGPIGIVSAFVRQWYFRQLTRNLRPILSRLPLIATSLLLLGGAATYLISQNSQPSMDSDKLWKKLDIEGQKAFDHGQKSQALETFKRSLDLAKKLDDKELTRASLNEMLDVYKAQGDSKKLDETKSELTPLEKPEKSPSEVQEDLDNELKKLGGQKITDSKEIERLDQLCGSAMDEATSLISSGNREAAKPIILTIKKIVETALPENDPLNIRCHHNLAHIDHLNSDYDVALTGFREALRLGNEILPTNDPLKSKTRVCIAWIHMQLGSNLEEAEKLVNECIVITRSNYGPHSSQLAGAWFQMAQLQVQQGRKAEAKSALNRAIKILEHSKDQKDKAALGSCYELLGKITRDKTLILKALETYEQETGKSYQQLSQVLIQLANLFVIDDPVQAQHYLDRASALTQHFNKTDQILMSAELLQSQSGIHQKTGNLSLAEQEIRSVIKMIEEHGDAKNGLGMLVSLGRLADVLQQEKDYKAAEEVYKEIFTRVEKSPHSKEGLGSAPFLAYVRLLNSQDRKTEAQAIADRWSNIK